ncbi:MAG: LOG family protein [Anaerolineae bacterium]
MKTIAVFGSGRPSPGSPAYEVARETGRQLAESGFAVATGGYDGTMSGVSQGAAEAGGHVIGVGSRQIERFRPGGLNEWVKEAIMYDTLADRLLHLVRHNDGMIALPGGIGTLSELALAWSFLQVGEIEKRPFVLIGKTWETTIQAAFNPDYIRRKHLGLLQFVATPSEAVTLVANGYK